MNHMTYNSKFAPWNIQDAIYIECECCYNRLSEIESSDPCIIEGRVFCDSCASNLVQLKFDGYIGGVSAKTKSLKITDDIFETLAKILKPNENK